MFYEFFAESEQGYYEEKLIEDIFKTRNYQKLARPVENESDALVVKFGLSLQQIVDVVRWPASLRRAGCQTPSTFS